MKEKIVVIGSNSFSGAHFVNHLLQEGLEVIGLSRSPELDPVFLPYRTNPNFPSFKFFQLDLNHHLDQILNIVHEFRPDYIVNFAAQGMVSESWQTPQDWFQTNTLASIQLHDQLRKCSFLKKYVHVSTPEVYGSCTGLVQENTIYQPSTPYAVSRAATDMSLMSFFKAYQFPVIFTRSANVYGRCQQLYRIIPKSILCFLNGEKLQLHGGGHSTRSFIHIDDVARGTLLVAQHALPGEIFHFSTSSNITIRKLVELIAEKMGVSFDDNVEIVQERLGKDSFYLLDNSKAKSMGWRDQVLLENGIDETIAWVKNNLDVIRKHPTHYIHKP